MSELIEIGRRIKVLRQSLNLTQEELAEKTGYTSRSSINKIELGLVDLPQSKIVLLAQALGVTPSYLLFGVVDTPVSTESEATEDVIIYHSDGKTVKKKLTKEHMAMLRAMLDTIPDTPTDV